ncbi:hypothetical protein [Shewanella algae]|uniref:hypothetical protein n=1 Tax=Shewanella TaxID=22 RepID=UPI0031F5234E
MKSKPSYFEYFTQVDDDINFDWSWINSADMSWVDELSATALEKKKARIEQDILNGRDPNDSFFSDEEPYSKDFHSVDFPSYGDWPKSFIEQYDNTVEKGQKKILDMCKTAEEVIAEDEWYLYLNCIDGNHYFRTPYYSHGEPSLVGLSDESDFDSIDTAVFAFKNDYQEWRKEHGDEYKRINTLMELEALRSDSNSGNIYNSVGIKAECDYCGGYGLIVAEIDNNDVCEDCHKQVQK